MYTKPLVFLFAFFTHALALSATFRIVSTLYTDSRHYGTTEKSVHKTKEDGAWLESPFISDIPVHIEIVNAIFNRSDLHVLDEIRARRANSAARANDSIFFEHNFTDKKLHTGECPGYTKYVFEHYDTLDDYTIFLHGGNNEHCDHDLYKIIHLLKRDIESEARHVSWYNLNTVRKFNMNFHGDATCQRVANILEFEDVFKETQDVVCCAQFVVRKDILRRRSKQWWNVAHKLSVEYPSCACFEHAWNIIFRVGARIPTHMRFVSLTKDDTVLDSPESIKQEEERVASVHRRKFFVCDNGKC